MATESERIRDMMAANELPPPAPLQDVYLPGEPQLPPNFEIGGAGPSPSPVMWLPEDKPKQMPDIPLMSETYTRQTNPYWATQRAQVDALLKGHTEEFQEDKEAYLREGRSIEDEAVRALEKYYIDAILEDQGVLNDLDQLPEHERIERLVFEYNRIDAQKLEIRELVALNMLRQGLGSHPGKFLDEITYNLTPSQAQALRKQRVRAMNEEFNRIIDRMAAREGEGFTTAVATGEIFQQDVVPFWGAATRILGTNKFLPKDADIGTLRKGFPGEIRQEIREWWIKATPDQRRMYLEDLDRELGRIRKSDTSGIYTHYLFVENFMGIFTEQMLQDSNAKDSFDRVMGNLDTGLGFLIGAGLFIRRGVSVAELFTGGRKNIAKQMAAAGGSRSADEALDAQISDLAKDLGMSTDEASLPQLAKPQQLELDLDGLDVELDTVKHTTAANVERRKRVLNYLDESESVLIDNNAKRDAVSRVIEDLSNRDTVHLHHKMSTVKGLPNGVGVEINAVVGSRGGEGWLDLTELLSDMKEMDPYQEFVLLRRSAKGKVEEIEVTWGEIVDYYAHGRVPDSMRPYIEPLSPEADEFARFFGGRAIHKVSMDELKSALDGDWIPQDSPMHDWVREEIRARNAKGVDSLGPDPLLALNGEEFFVRFKTTHYFDAQDMKNIDGFRYFDIPGVQTAVRFIGRLFPPNTKFGKLYEAARKSYHMEEASLAEFADILVKFDNLPPQRKRNVMEMIEWSEDYAKDMYHETGVARAPTVEELIGEFSHFDDATFEGFLAHREAMDGLYDVLNRRLVRDFTNRGAVTMRGRDDMLPSYHGLPMRTDAPRPKGDAPDTRFVPGKYYDPVKREMVDLDAEEIADIVNNGGGAIKLDFAVDMPGGGRTTRILARPGEYEIGSLSKRVLNKYEGYNFRFYEDPYFIVKRHYGATVDGVKIADDEYIEEAVRTATSQADGRRFLGKMREMPGGEYVDTRNPNVRFVIQRAKDINATEGRLYQKQALHREGRMFWDQRAHERLPDTTGNLAKVADPFQAMQKGLAMALRQTTQEGLFDAIKKGFMNEFAHLPLIKERGGLVELEELADLERDLVKAKNASAGNLRRDYRSAIEYVRYMRSQLGTDTWAVPALRAFTLNILEWLDAYTKGVAREPLGFLQKHAMTMDPFARARKIAYGAFMVLRPARQLVLQSMQISMLTGLAPTYIGSGKIFIDAYGLRRGLTRYRRAGFDDGWSDAKIAKAMGLSKKEYRRLVEEFQRSGMMGSVNTHAFNASGRNLSAHLDPNAGPMGRMAYNARARGRQVFNGLARGFEIGEQNNLTFSFLMGLRRIKAKHKIDDITKLTRQQWDEVVLEADSLALAMTRPNKFAYQSGATGTLFQFLSFQHRALLTFAGLNPAIKGKDIGFVVLGNYVLWGTHMFGADTFIEEMLAQNGLSLWGQDEIADGVTIQDLLISGVVDVGLNTLMREMDSKHNNLDLGVLAPGGNIAQLYEGFYDLVTSSPVDMEFLGPFANQANGFMQGLQLSRAHVANQYMPPEQKFLKAAEAFGTNIIPQLNDLQKVWVAAQMNEWVTKSNDPLGIQPHITDLVARGVMGLRTDEELSIYRARQNVWENDETINDWVKTWRPVLRNIVSSWEQGEYTPERAYELASMVHSLTEDAPEGVRREIYKRLMSSADADGKSINQLIAEAASKGSMNIAALIPSIEKSSMTPEQKKLMVDFVRQVQDGYVGADEKYRQIIESELDAREVE